MKYCDLKCSSARWPDRLEDGSKTCRTFVALYCEKLQRLVDKNAPCCARETDSSDLDEQHD